jgi:uncharacterized protein
VTPIRIQTTPEGVRLTVRVQPRASSSGIVGAHGESLKVRLTAPPVEGAANEALVELLSRTFGIPARFVTLVTGASSRTKTVELQGITEDRVRRLLQL